MFYLFCSKVINLYCKRNREAPLVFGPYKYLWTLPVLLLLLLLGAWLGPVWYDDAGHYIVIREALAGHGFCYPGGDSCDPGSPFITLGLPLNVLYAAFMGLFGGSMLAGRIATVLFSLLAAAALGELGRRFFSPQKAVWAILLLLGNIQFLSYGSQVLGEAPMLACLLWGLLALGTWLERRTWQAALAGAACFFGAVMCKAYIAPPIALGYGAFLMLLAIKGEGRAFWALLVQALAWGLVLVLYFVLEQGGWQGFLAFLERRSSYGSEFFAFQFTEALRFLLFKPLFWLGTGAMALRIYFQKRPLDMLLACFQGALLLLFLFSAGYDRFGFLLLFLPALFFAEYMAAAWKRLGRRRWQRMGFALLAAALFYQQSPLILGGRLLDPDATNRAERRVVEVLGSLEREGGPLSVFTYDQQLIPFLPANMAFRLPEVVPSNAADCQALALRPGEVLVAGDYARTEYPGCIPWGDLQALDSVGTGEGRYVIWGRGGG